MCHFYQQWYKYLALVNIMPDDEQMKDVSKISADTTLHRIFQTHISLMIF